MSVKTIKFKFRNQVLFDAACMAKLVVNTLWLVTTNSWSSCRLYPVQPLSWDSKKVNWTTSCKLGFL